MNLSAQEITAELFTLPEQEQQEVFDFIEFLKAKSARRQAKRFLENPATQQTEGEKILAILERVELLGCMEGGDENLSENYKEHLWGNE